MYAETDRQAPREFYFQGKPWEKPREPKAADALH